MKCEKCDNEAPVGHAECSECVGKALERLAALNLPGVFFVNSTNAAEKKAPRRIKKVLKALRGK